MKPPTNLGKLKVIGIREKPKGKALFPNSSKRFNDQFYGKIQSVQMSFRQEKQEGLEDVGSRGRRSAARTAGLQKLLSRRSVG